MAINPDEFLHLNNLISQKTASEKDKENFVNYINSIIESPFYKNHLNHLITNISYSNDFESIQLKEESRFETIMCKILKFLNNFQLETYFNNVYEQLSQNIEITYLPDCLLTTHPFEHIENITTPIFQDNNIIYSNGSDLDNFIYYYDMMLLSNFYLEKNVSKYYLPEYNIKIITDLNIEKYSPNVAYIYNSKELPFKIYKPNIELEENFLTIHYKLPEFLNNKIIKVNFID